MAGIQLKVDFSYGFDRVKLEASDEKSSGGTVHNLGPISPTDRSKMVHQTPASIYLPLPLSPNPDRFSI